MMVARFVVSLVVLLLAAAMAAAQPTVRLEGRLIHVEGRETGRVGLSFGPFGTTVTRPDGFFTHVLPAETAEVTLDVEDNGWTVLYPRNGRLAIPRSEGIIVEVVAGDPIDQVIAKTLAEKHQRLLAELTNLGAEQDQIRVVLQSFLDDVKTRLDVDEAAFREAVDLAEERRAKYPEIAAALHDYVLKAKDVKDAFRLLAEIAISNPPLVLTIDSTLIAYNEAFETLNSRHAGFEQAVAAHWQNERLTAEFRSLMDYALGEIHRSLILQLNESLVGIHNLPTLRRSDRRARGSEIARDIRRIVEQLVLWNAISIW